MILLGTFESEENRFDVKLTVDGDVVEKSNVRYRSNDAKMSITIKDEAASLRVAEESYDELENYVADISLAIPAGPAEIFRTVTIAFADRKAQPICIVLINVNPSLASWSKPWSFIEYVSAFRTEVESRSDSGCRMVTQDIARALRLPSYESVSFEDFDREKPLVDVIEKISVFIQDVHESAERQLTTNLNRNSLVTFFDFPPTVRVACEQYLQYFIQFLDDLGIEADSQISSEAGKVLFSVTPRSDEEALETIQQALAAFLEIPRTGDLSGQEAMGNDIAIIQLRANVSHLQGQLQIAHGIAQLGQATIQQQNATINTQVMQIAMFQRDQLIRSSLPEAPRLENNTPVVKQDSDPLIGDFVKVVPITGKGFAIDLPKMLRKLKRHFPGSKR